MTLTELAPGLRRWTTRHEAWKEDVGCVAVDTDDGLVLIDSLDPPRELGRAEHALVTVFFHARSTQAKHVWAEQRLVRRLASRGVAVDRPFTAGDALPGGIQAFQTARKSEVVYWLPLHRAVVVGDVLLGAGAKPHATDDPLRMCPERWLEGATYDDLRESFAPLLSLPVESVLVSHGEPVLSDGGDALATALAG